jgi:tetratricopeptide (TPR) repeat protein
MWRLIGLLLLLTSLRAEAHEGDALTLRRLNDAVARFSDDLSLHMQRADLARRLNDREVAMQEVLWLSRGPIERPDTAMLIGELYETLGDQRSALAFLRLATELAPWFAPARLRYAQALATVSPKASALEFQAAALQSTSPDVWFLCASHCASHPSICDAAEWFLLGYVALGAPALQLSAAQVLVTRGAHAEAKSLIDAALAVRPSSKLWRELRASIEEQSQ